ncbi:MAG: CotH kinase family protein, partial [Candidatus Hinthialibacter sp.]
WYIFPWDKDKTWGDSDAYRDILPYYDFYDFPILFGAYGTPQSGTGNRTWWRPPGYFSGPILANADLQWLYLHRLGYVALHEFTEERWIPIIDALEARLEPEVRHKAEISGSNVNSRLNDFHLEIESLRRQVVNRRRFILNEVEKLIGPVSVRDWALH